MTALYIQVVLSCGGIGRKPFPRTTPDLLLSRAVWESYKTYRGIKVIIQVVQVYLYCRCYGIVKIIREVSSGSYNPSSSYFFDSSSRSLHIRGIRHSHAVKQIWLKLSYKKEADTM